MSMTTLAQFNRLVIGNYKGILHRRTTSITPLQISSYTRKSAEYRLGIEKPKRPLTPFFKFMVQMRPAILAKNPGISAKEAVTWSSKHWQQLDADTKSKMMKEYEKDYEDYKKIKDLYLLSLTDEQKEDIKRVKQEMADVKEKRKLKAELKELGKPKKPLSSFLLFSKIYSETNNVKYKSVVEYQKALKIEWDKLTDIEKSKYEKQAQELMKKYRKDLQEWEIEMVSLGRQDLVRSSNKVNVKKTLSEKNKK